MKSTGSTPGYLQIRRYVYSLIASASGDEAVNCKLTTEQELCKIFSMSTGTVRKALDALVAEGLLLRRPRHGTFINPSVLKLHHKSSYVGIIIGDGNACVYDPFIMMELSGIFQNLSESNHLCQLINFSGGTEQSLLSYALDKSSGVIWLQPAADKLDVLRMIRDKLAIPLVLVNPLFGTDEFPCVRIDYYQMGFEATKRLLALGHRRILFLDSNSEIQYSLKRDGVREAYRAANLPWDERDFLTGSSLALMDQFEEIIAKESGYTAVFCSGAMHEAVRQKLQDGHCSFKMVGNNCGDQNPALFDIRILVSLEELGKCAVDLLQAPLGSTVRMIAPVVQDVNLNTIVSKI